MKTFTQYITENNNAAIHKKILANKEIQKLIKEYLKKYEEFLIRINPMTNKQDSYFKFSMQSKMLDVLGQLRQTYNSNISHIGKKDMWRGRVFTKKDLWEVIVDEMKGQIEDIKWELDKANKGVYDNK